MATPVLPRQTLVMPSKCFSPGKQFTLQGLEPKDSHLPSGRRHEVPTIPLWTLHYCPETLSVRFSGLPCLHPRPLCALNI